MTVTTKKIVTNMIEYNVRIIVENHYEDEVKCHIGDPFKILEKQRGKLPYMGKDEDGFFRYIGNNEDWIEECKKIISEYEMLSYIQLEKFNKWDGIMKTETK